MPRDSAVTSSMFERGIAVEYTTASARSGTCSARLPTRTSTPAAARRSSTGVLLMSEPLTSWPIRASSSAIALMPAPATPTMCTRFRPDRSSDAGPGVTASPDTRVLLDEVGEPGGGVGAAERSGRGAHRREAAGILGQLGDDHVEPERIAFVVGQHDGG